MLKRPEEVPLNYAPAFRGRLFVSDANVEKTLIFNGVIGTMAAAAVCTLRGGEEAVVTLWGGCSFCSKARTEIKQKVFR